MRTGGESRGGGKLPRAQAAGAMRSCSQGAGHPQGAQPPACRGWAAGRVQDCKSLGKIGERQGRLNGILVTPKPGRRMSRRQWHWQQNVPEAQEPVTSWRLASSAGGGLAAGFALAAASAAAGWGGRLVFATAPPAIVCLFRCEVDCICRAAGSPMQRWDTLVNSTRERTM